MLVLLCACNTSNIEEAIKTLDTNITYQEFYGMLYEEIKQNDILRQVYLPDISREIGYTALCGDLKFEKGSYEEALYKVKEKNSAPLYVETRKYSQGETSNEIRWVWDISSGNVWENLLSDYGEIAPEYIDAVNFFCDSGLAQIEENSEEYILKINPNSNITYEKAAQIRGNVLSYKQFMPLNAVKTYDYSGNEILLCFSDTLSLFTFKNLINNLHENSELLRSFIYFDLTGTAVSLWIQSNSGGVFSVPLDFASGREILLEYAGSAILEHRINIISSIIPNGFKKYFTKESLRILNESGKSHKLCYKTGSDFAKTISVTFLPSGKNRGTVRIQCA